MASSTGPMLAVGAVTLVNQSVINDEPFDWRVVIATGLAAGGLALAETIMPEVAPMIAWAALITVLFVRINRGVPAPAEAFVNLVK